ncbi:MAG: hypothetical protein WCD76_18460, partial [Pyrinomonadaceae bacterium]
MAKTYRLQTLPALLIIALFCNGFTTLAQGTATARQGRTIDKKFELTVDSIMRGPDLVGYPPTNIYWSQDSSRVYFRWKRAGEPRLKEASLYVVNRDGTGLRKLSDEETRTTAPPSTGELSKDKTQTVFAEDGDIFLFDHTKNTRRQITRTTDAETNPHFTRDRKHVSFTRQNNLYMLSLDGAGTLEQLTDIRANAGSGEQSASARAVESQGVIKKEERALLEAVRERAENREEVEAKRKAKEKRRFFPIPAGQSLTNLSLAPDGAYVIVTLTEPGAGAKNTIVPNYVTESAYTEEIPGRTKVGDAQGRTRLAVISTETGEFKWVEHGQRVEVSPRVQTRTESNATEGAGRE